MKLRPVGGGGWAYFAVRDGRADVGPLQRGMYDLEVTARGREPRRVEARELVPGAPPLAIELGPRDAPRAVILLEAGWNVTLEENAWSPGYGERRPAVRVALERIHRLPARLRWVVLFGVALSG